MGKLFRGEKQKFFEPKAIAAPAAAAPDAAKPMTEIQTGGDESASSTEELRRKYRPSKGIGSTGTGLSV